MEKLQELDPIIHSRIRLSILSMLISVEEADFVYLKEATGTTDGNLSTHLTKLENAEYVKITKEFLGKKPRTTCSITDKGKEAFSKYVKTLELFIHPSS